MQPSGTTQARAYPRQGIRQPTERPGSVHLTRLRTPRVVVHVSKHRLQGRFGEGFDLQRGEGDEAESPGRFWTRTSLFQSGYGTVAPRGLAKYRGKQHFHTNVGIARTIATTPLSTRTPQRSRRTKSHGSSTKDSSRPSPKWKQVTERWPNAVASKVALLLKTREDGTTKVRLIIDLRSS